MRLELLSYIFNKTFAFVPINIHTFYCAILSCDVTSAVPSNLSHTWKWYSNICNTSFYQHIAYGDRNSWNLTNGHWCGKMETYDLQCIWYHFIKSWQSLEMRLRLNQLFFSRRFLNIKRRIKKISQKTELNVR